MSVRITPSSLTEIFLPENTGQIDIYRDQRTDAITNVTIKLTEKKEGFDYYGLISKWKEVSSENGEEEGRAFTEFVLDKLQKCVDELFQKSQQRIDEQQTQQPQQDDSSEEKWECCSKGCRKQKSPHQPNSEPIMVDGWMNQMA